MPRKNHQPKHQKFNFEPSCQAKRRYLSQQQADQAIELAEFERPGVKLKTYRCPKCSGWHLTSTE